MFTIKNGQDISAYVNTLFIYESLCKPYITIKAIIIDDNLIIDSLVIVGGETVTFEIQSEGGGSYRSNDLRVYSIKKDQSNINKRAMVYELEAFGPEYFGDRTQLVQKSFEKQTGTDIIKNIHSEYLGTPIQIAEQSLGLLYDKNFLNINSTKVFKAIDDIRKMITFAKYPSGLNVYYRDKDSAKLAPAEYLFEQVAKGDGPTFIQRATWGASWQDIANSTNAIIDAVTNITDMTNSGRTIVHENVATVKQELKVLDANSNKMIINQNAAKVPDPKVAGTPFSSLAGQIMGKIMASLHGGKHNYLKVDTQKVPPAAVRRTDREQLLKAMIAGSVTIYVKVPIQGGLLATVGKGVNLELLPPIGADQTTSTNEKSVLSGPALVADLCHEIHNDNMLSSTTMRCLKGGYNS